MSSECPFPKTITLFLRLNNPEFGQMHLAKTRTDGDRLVLNDNEGNPDLNDPNNPLHNALVGMLCTGGFDRPPGSPEGLLHRLAKGTLLGVTINPVTRVIFEIWLPHPSSLQRGCPGKPIWGF